jgi:hypothetical protein
MVEKKTVEREKRPTWTMDVMILSNLNEIAKYIDDAAVRAETGDINALLNWKAGLKEFYRNLRSFLVPQADALAVTAFVELDKTIDVVSRLLPNSEQELRRTFQLLDYQTTLMYQCRNDLFMRFIEMMSPTEKSTRYNLQALPPAELQKKVDEKLRKKEQEDMEVEENPS